jgi:hypothetical protein
MRPILALAILLLGLNAAVAEAKYQDSLPIVGEHPFTSSLEFNVSIGAADSKLVLAVPSEPAEAAHDQAEDAGESPLSPDPASTDVDAKGHVAPSVDDLCHALRTSAEDNDLPVPFFANLIWQESRLQLDAVSKVGALGIAQFMPEVAAEVGLGNPFDPRQAIPASARFLHALRQHFGNLGFVAAAYNAGAHRVADWLEHRRALPPETRTYVVRVTGRSAEAWRKSPLDDSQLTFVRPLPCRGLPAFADLEATQMRARSAQEAHQQPQTQREQSTAKPPRLTAPARKVAQKVVSNVASRTAQKAKKKVPVGHGLVTERKEVRRVARSRAAHKIAGNFHAGKHEATRRQHASHEKGRVA